METGDTFPDITMLPEISAFFKVSINELLGVNKAENEEEIARLLEEHDNLSDEKLIWESISCLKDKYPNDFRVQLRYMGYLIFYMKIADNKLKILSIYENNRQSPERHCRFNFCVYFLYFSA